jgi:hypothetical protein
MSGPANGTRRAAGLIDLPGSHAVNPRNGPRLRTDDPNTNSPWRKPWHVGIVL